MSAFSRSEREGGRVRGGTETYIAWSEQPLAKDATVLVIESRSAGAMVIIQECEGSR